MAGFSLRRFDGGAVNTAAPAFDPQERVYVVAHDGRVRCLDPSTGGEGWAVTPGGPIRVAPVVHAGRALVADTRGSVVALDSGGVVQWRTEVGSGCRGGLAVGPDGLVVVGSEDAHVHALEEDGRPRWSTHLGLPVRGVPALDADGNVLVPGLDLHLWSLHGADGAVRWRRSLGNVSVGRPCCGPDGIVAVATLGGEVRGVGAVDGVIRWTRSLGSPVVGGVVRLADGWAVGTVNGEVVALDEGGDTRWQHTVGGAVGARPAAGPVPVDEAHEWLFVVTSHGVLAAFDAEGACRARWDVWAGQPTPPTHALAGVAAGHHGVAVTTVAGPTLYAPWNAPTQEPAGWAVRPAADLAIERGATGEPSGPPPLPLRASHWQVDTPRLVSALDPIAGWTLDVALLEAEGDEGVGWGLLTHEAGVERIAMNARRAGDTWEFAAPRVSVPWMGMRVVLSTLRIIAGSRWGRVTAHTTVAPALPSWMALRDHPAAALERSGRPFLAARAFWERMVSNPPSIRQLVDFGQGTVRALAALPRLADAEVWGAWGLLDEARRFRGEGRVAVQAAPEGAGDDVVVDHVRADAARRLVEAAVGGSREALLAAPLSILLVDIWSTPEVVAIDYARRTTVIATDDGTPAQVVLEIPLDTNLGRPVEAWVLIGGRVAWRGPLTRKTA